MEKRFLSIVLILLMLVIALVSCGEKAPGPQGERGLQGEQGADGKTAFELAKEQGFSGTLEEWLLSLVGEKGEIGAEVVSIEKSATNGIIDTYTITFSNNTTQTFEIINGKTGVGIS